ncbi:MAG TPA: hypothetical protein VMQ50_11020 [Casimicrobiaceae bacterium]|nr:hypothetical protein [Casimicrobiaceae bacterium]
MGATLTYNGAGCTSFTLSGNPPNQTLTCVTSGGGGGVPVCAPTASPASPVHGHNAVISANCTNSPTSYVWTGSGCVGSGATCTVMVSKAGATRTFTVKGSNAAGTGTAAQIPVTWQ